MNESLPGYDAWKTHDPRDDEPEEPEEECAHEWAFTGTAYGGDDESYHGEGRCYCTKCGADGDA